MNRMQKVFWGSFILTFLVWLFDVAYSTHILHWIPESVALFTLVYGSSRNGSRKSLVYLLVTFIAVPLLPGIIYWSWFVAAMAYLLFSFVYALGWGLGRWLPNF